MAAAVDEQAGALAALLQRGADSVHEGLGQGSPAIALDGEGEPYELEADGLLAICIQHELDHLKGQMFTDVMDKESFMFNYWNVVNHREGEFKMGFFGVDGVKAKVLPFSLFKQTKS